MSYTIEEVKAKSASKLSGLHCVVRKATEALIEICYNRGVPIVITQGLRTIEEQNSLYAQGRTTSGQIVTNAKGGYSFHNFGLAIDFALLLDNGGVTWDMKRDSDGDGTPDWNEVVTVAKALGFVWGGDWKSFTDLPHFEINFGLSTAQLRAGKRPTQAQIDAVVAKVNKTVEELDELSAEDKKRLDNLEAAVKGLTESRDVLKQFGLDQSKMVQGVAERVTKLEGKASMTEVPAWAKTAVDAAVKAGLLDTPNGGSYDFYRTLKVLYTAGLLITEKEA